MDRYFKYMPLILISFVLFLSIGFSSFSVNLSAKDISASVRPTDYIRITKFYSLGGENGGKSNWEEFGKDILAANISLPNKDSSVSFKVTVTNISDVIMMINDISNLPEGITYELEDYNLQEKICNKNICNNGVQKDFVIKFKYKDDASVSNNQSLRLEIEFKSYTYKIKFNSNGGTGTMDDYEIGYDEIGILPANTYSKEGYMFASWNTKEDGTGTSYKNKQSIQNISNGANVELYAQWILKSTTTVKYNGECTFNGKGNEVSGECSPNDGSDIINTGIKLFSEENYAKNFVLSFTITSVDDSRFSAGKRDTIFNALYEADNKIAGKYPGILLRIEGNKWQLQGGDGKNNSTKVQFAKNDLIGKELKIIRYNNGSSIKIYYMVDNKDLLLLRDVTNLYSTFDTPLTFGSNLLIDNVTEDRHAYATLKDISFEFLNDGITLDEIISGGGSSSTPTATFAYNGPCTFNGNKGNITGNNCPLYSNEKYINTNVSLFSTNNFNKDFDVYFEINRYVPSEQEEAQVTLLNAFLERTGKGYGILLRRNNNNLNFIVRDGTGVESEMVFAASSVSAFRIVRKDNNICYSINNGPMKYVVNFDRFSQPFNTPLTFGSSIDQNGNPWRYITGELSNMYIILGDIGDNVYCNSTLK